MTDTNGRTSGAAGRMSGCQVGCLVLLGVGTLLLVVGMLLLAELEKGLDGYGQLEEGADGTSGSVADPLAPGATAEYEDGLRVTVGEVERVAGAAAGTYRFTVTYENDSDGELRIGERGAETNASEYDDAPLVVRAGESLDDTGAEDGSTSDWHNREAAGRTLTKPLGEDESVTVPVRVTVSPGNGDKTSLTVSVLPEGQDAGMYRDTAYWQMTLRG
ncbi:hypothetical protein ACTWQF_03795 [Streptomyces sp. 8N114]|uniref:hypothetical protein n=1 Tax=Streptomyces sp. 8N114 TaxID=3457419 RepID=UPI003FCF4752